MQFVCKCEDKLDERQQHCTTLPSLCQLNSFDVWELVFDCCLYAHSYGWRAIEFDCAHTLLHCQDLHNIPYLHQCHTVMLFV